MRASFVPLTVAAIALSAMAAFAAETMTSGVVKSYDMKAQSLTLEDGSVYVISKDFKDPGLKAGEKVAVKWQVVDGKNHADSVTITK